MTKHRYVHWTVLAAIMIFFNCFASDSAPGAAGSYEAYSVPASVLAGDSGPGPDPYTGSAYNASEKRVPSPEITPLPHSETALSVAQDTYSVTVSNVNPAPDQQAADKQSPGADTAGTPVSDLQGAPDTSPGRVSDANQAPALQDTQEQSSGTVSTAAPTPALQAEREQQPEYVSAASPTPAPTEKKSEIIYPIKSFDDKTRICLTFDDGGNRNAVKKALEVLKKHEVKATFFVVGKYLKTNEALWKQAIEDGHHICNHTQNHVWLTQLKDEGVKKEILEWESVAGEIFGQEYIDKMKREFPFVRLPGGAGNDSKRVLRIVSELGYVPVGWNLETYYAVLRLHDLKTEPVDPIADEVFAHVSKKVKGGSIVLLHFNPYDTARLDEIITAIKEKELEMNLLSECIEY